MNEEKNQHSFDEHTQAVGVLTDESPEQVAGRERKVEQDEAKIPTMQRAARPTDFNYSEYLVVFHQKNGLVAEKYRTLRSALLAKHNKLTCIITSAQAGEGKTVTTINLAFVLNECKDKQIIIVDADFRKSNVAKFLGIKSTPGLADVLSRRVPLYEAIRTTYYPNVYVMSAGEVQSSQIGGLLSGPELPVVVDELRKDYDFILIDTPPINEVSDAGIISQVVGKALIVVKMNSTHKKYVKQTINLLQALNVDIEGLILTHYKPDIPKYLSYYV